ncbi:hypothetical protein [Nocardioides astragali]|uniref:Uncharacterized protein n=1 Tax=Nocardioides astragali TaxID=1776736 RepID=A0ABW2N552_9ACTN|nr:hypothetical protein [Nocardioides astragali]
MGERTSSTASGQAGNAIYGIGMFGAWVYFWMQADGFWQSSGRPSPSTTGLAPWAPDDEGQAERSRPT